MRVFKFVKEIVQEKERRCSDTSLVAGNTAPSSILYRIMYELAVCSDGMTEAQPRSFRQNRPASEYII